MAIQSGNYIDYFVMLSSAFCFAHVLSNFTRYENKNSNLSFWQRVLSFALCKRRKIYTIWRETRVWALHFVKKYCLEYQNLILPFPSKFKIYHLWFFSEAFANVIRALRQLPFIRVHSWITWGGLVVWSGPHICVTF